MSAMLITGQSHLSIILNKISLRSNICILKTLTLPSGLHNRAIPGHILPTFVVYSIILNTVTHWHLAHQAMAQTIDWEIQS